MSRRIIGICGIDWCGICGKSAAAHKRKATRVNCVERWIQEQKDAGIIQSAPLPYVNEIKRKETTTSR